MKKLIDPVFGAAILILGIAIGVFGRMQVHDYIDAAHEVTEVEAEHGHGQPFLDLDESNPETGFTMYDGEMILVVEVVVGDTSAGDRVLTFYRDDLAEVCADAAE